MKTDETLAIIGTLRGKNENFSLIFSDCKIKIVHYNY